MDNMLPECMPLCAEFLENNKKPALMSNVEYLYQVPPLYSASVTGQLQVSPHVAGARFSTGKSTIWTVTTMGSIDLVVSEDHLLAPSHLSFMRHASLTYMWQVRGSPLGSPPFGRLLQWDLLTWS